METTTENLPAALPQVNGHALTTSNPLPMPVSPAFVIERYKAIQEIVKGVFEEDIHYGKIPGTGDKKSLLKAGAEALCSSFQFTPDFIKQPESIERPDFIHLVYKCELRAASGRVIATGVGSCNSKEEKYRWTTMARKCPACGKEAIAKSKEEWGGGWYCNAKKDGCGAKFKKGDRSIEDQEAGRKENDNPWNFHNTLGKMAQKRALVAATLIACGISGQFTQDVEDFEPLANDKTKRGDEGIDLQANGWRARAEADDRQYEDSPGADVYPWPGSEAPTPAEDAQFTAAEPALPADVAAARLAVLLELETCTEKMHFHLLKAKMQAWGGAYLDARVTQEVNIAYANKFPAKPTPTYPPAP